MLVKLLLEVLVQVVNLLVHSLLQSVQELLLDSGLKLGSDQSLCLAFGFTLFDSFVDRLDCLLGVHAAELDSALSDEKLMELGETLLRFMTLELCPELEMLVEHLQSLLVVLRQLYFLP